MRNNPLLLSITTSLSISIAVLLLAACSYNLVHWTDWKGEPLVQSSEPYDSHYAHKSCVVKWDGVVYHFYCAVDDAGNRGIALATSRDLLVSLHN